MHNERYALSSRHRTLSLVAVLTSTAGLGVAYGIGYTITTIQLAAWGEPGRVIGLAGAVPALAVVLVLPLAPRLAGRLGAVAAMVLGAALVAVTFALMPVLDSTGWWLLLRFLSGAGLALPWLIGETWINTVVPDRVRGRVLATYTILLFSGWAAGPLLLERIGTTGPAPFAIGVLGMTLAALPLVLARRLAPALPGHGRSSPRAAVALAPLAMGAALVGGVAEFGYISLLPVYALEAGASGTTALRLLSVLLVGGITLQLAIGWLADHVDRTRLLAALGAALAVGSVTFALLVRVDGIAYVAAFALGGVVIAFYAVGLTMLGEQVSTGKLAVANAAFLISYEVGATVGPVVGGAAMDVWRPHGLIVVIAAVGVGFTVLIQHRRSVQEGQPAPAQGGAATRT